MGHVLQGLCPLSYCPPGPDYSPGTPPPLGFCPPSWGVCPPEVLSPLGFCPPPPGFCPGIMATWIVSFGNLSHLCFPWGPRPREGILSSWDSLPGILSSRLIYRFIPWNSFQISIRRPPPTHTHTPTHAPVHTYTRTHARSPHHRPHTYPYTLIPVCTQIIGKLAFTFKSNQD